jgi:LAS superfamily LD-carboxypeptidase LdcB
LRACFLKAGLAPAFLRQKVCAAPWAREALMRLAALWYILAMLNDLELTGRARTHAVQHDELGAALHSAVLEPFLDMKADAARVGIDIAITSGFRDFDAQKRIWNLKWLGERPLYDAEGNARDHAELAPLDLLHAILCWSALPGASRHHWGSELDVIDRAAMPEGYRVKLTPDEVGPGGVFHALHCWLDENMARYDFFRPYATFRGGVQPEAWHISYAAVSVPALAALTPQLVETAIRASDILGKNLVLERIAALHRRYVANVDVPADQRTSGTA